MSDDRVPKFRPKDRFFHKETHEVGTIKAISFNSIHQVWEYYVSWDCKPKEEVGYEAHVGDSKWEVVTVDSNHVSNIIKSSSEEITTWQKYEPKELSRLATNPDCGHKWKIYNSGWTEYEYCTECNKRREQ